MEASRSFAHALSLAWVFVLDRAHFSLEANTCYVAVFGTALSPPTHNSGKKSVTLVAYGTAGNSRGYCGTQCNNRLKKCDRLLSWPLYYLDLHSCLSGQIANSLFSLFISPNFRSSVHDLIRKNGLRTLDEIPQREPQTQIHPRDFVLVANVDVSHCRLVPLDSYWKTLKDVKPCRWEQWINTIEREEELGRYSETIKPPGILSRRKFPDVPRNKRSKEYPSKVVPRRNIHWAHVPEKFMPHAVFLSSCRYQVCCGNIENLHTCNASPTHGRPTNLSKCCDLDVRASECIINRI